MRYRDRISCQNRCERELNEAAQRLEFLRISTQRLRLDLRSQLERRLDEVRGRHNRGVARLEALRRAEADCWGPAAERAEEAVSALWEALGWVEDVLGLRPLAA